jgi:hypothetical protein
MDSLTGFVSRNEDKTALRIIATVIVYCIYACLTFYRARSQRCIVLKGDEERGTRYVKRIEITQSATTVTRPKHNEPNTPLKLIDIDIDEKGDARDAHVRLTSHNAKSQIVLASESYEGVSVLETTVSAKTGLIDLGDFRTEPCSVVEERMESGGSVAVVGKLGRKKKAKRESAWAEECANLGSMGTRGIPISRGDAEISMGDDEDEGN